MHWFYLCQYSIYLFVCLFIYLFIADILFAVLLVESGFLLARLLLSHWAALWFWWGVFCGMNLLHSVFSFNSDELFFVLGFGFGFFGGLLLFWILVFWDRVCLSNLGCPGIHYIDHAGLKLTEICLPSAGIRCKHHHCPLNDGNLVVPIWGCYSKAAMHVFLFRHTFSSPLLRYLEVEFPDRIATNLILKDNVKAGDIAQPVK